MKNRPPRRFALHHLVARVPTHVPAFAMALVLCASAADPARAQSARNCGPRDDVVMHLAERFGETRQSIGLSVNNRMVEVFASGASGSWTITATSPAGLTCLIATGQAFETLTEILPVQGEDA